MSATEKPISPLSSLIFASRWLQLPLLFLQGNVVVGYLLTYVIMLMLAVLSVLVARRI